jgi:hypothetical protein
MLGTKNVNEGISVTLPHGMLVFQKRNLLHVFLAGNLFQFGHPKLDRFSVGFFNRRKIGFRTLDLVFAHNFILVE